MKYIFDTNAVINFVCDTGDFSILKEIDDFFISFIELSVGYRTKEEEHIAGLFLDKINKIMINNEIIIKTIDIRKRYGLKLPDSIITATAITENAVLITSDKEIIKKAKDMAIDILDPLQ